VLFFYCHGIYALWWLVFMHRAVSAPSVPKWVWCGIAVGSVFALFFNSFEFTFTELPPFVSYDDHWGMISFGAGALLLVVPVLLFMLVAQKSDCD